MPAYATLSVSGIGSTATERDVRRHFERVLPGCEPVVSDLVRDPHNGTKVTTVTFKRKSKQACKIAITKLKDERKMIDAVAFSYNLAFSQSFLDLTLLASRSSEPTFDVYLVHGLGGFAFKSFASRPRDHKRVQMWPRDFLPDVLDDPTLGSGRYLTFGYRAPIMDSDRITESIKETAQNLLRAIVQERGVNCQRPLFFVCHSLGGLVVAQAILLLLRDQEIGTELWEFQKVLCPSGDCLVKGITFFGTPFRGSSLANLLAKISTVLRLPLNRSHIMSLRVKDEDVARIVDEFKRRSSEIKLPLLTFFELLPEKLGIFKRQVVSRDSAKGLGDPVRAIGLMESHRGMVKFKSAQERVFRKNVAPAIRDVVHTALRDYRLGDQAAQRATLLATLPQRHQRLLQLPQEEESRPPVPKQQEIVKGGLDHSRQQLVFKRTFSDREIHWLNDLEVELRFNHDPLQLGRKERMEVSPGSCQWILEKTQYQA
ncbi:hypothetical protein BKA65DRAFT_225074 [Rhexocercosporidium sp. MPI-PUGE-AT-0058]|nr:hypothetical protein BKA65DRAFT_225074 [Rhexocercosporidium sp. MPI-PUGE-AT-0058]